MNSLANANLAASEKSSFYVIVPLWLAPKAEL
jgi:hypothetical protein